MATESNVEEVCRRLQSVHLQLKIILERNLEIQGHLVEVEKLASEEDGPKLQANREYVFRELAKTKRCTEKVKVSAEQQCEVLRKTVEELERHADDPSSALHLVPNTDFTEVRFQLKSQLDRNIQLQKEKAELEMRLDDQIRAYQLAGDMTIKLQEEFEASKKMVMEMADSMDNRTKEADERLLELQKETEEAQKLAGKFQEKYKNEKSKNQDNGFTSSVNSSNSAGSPPNGHCSGSFHDRRVKSALPRPAEIDSRYISVVEENSKLKGEVKRLKEDNKDLVKKTKSAIKDVDQVQQHITTCSAQRMELQKRLRKEQEQNRRLSSNMTKQANDWVIEKKLTRTTENNNKIKNIHTEPVFEGHIRTTTHPIKMSEDKPRDIPVHNW